MKAQFSAQIKMLIIELLIAVHFCRRRKAEKCLFELSRIWRCIGQKAPVYVRLLREMIIFRDLDYPSLGSFRTVSSHSFIFSRCEAETHWNSKSTPRVCGVTKKKQNKDKLLVFFSLFELWRSEKLVSARNSQISDLHLMKVIETENGVKLASFRRCGVKNIDIW